MYFIGTFALFSIVAAHDYHVDVVGGSDAAQGQFPFVVALKNSGTDMLCDGVILNKNWILTVAECQYLVDPVAAVGNVSVSGGTEFKIDQITAHEDYDTLTGKNDIALMHFQDELIFDENVQPIEIGEVEDSENCTIIGWGNYTFRTRKSFEILQYVETTTINIEKCKNLTAEVWDVSVMYFGPETLCTVSSKENASTGFTDLGGPLVCNGKLAGIIDYKVNHAGDKYPDVYVRASSYVDWIQTNMVFTTTTTIPTTVTNSTTEHSTSISGGSVTTPSLVVFSVIVLLGLKRGINL